MSFGRVCFIGDFPDMRSIGIKNRPHAAVPTVRVVRFEIAARDRRQRRPRGCARRPDLVAAPAGLTLVAVFVAFRPQWLATRAPGDRSPSAAPRTLSAARTVA
jgi:hypothetical protein